MAALNIVGHALDRPAGAAKLAHGHLQAGLTVGVEAFIIGGQAGEIGLAIAFRPGHGRQAQGRGHGPTHDDEGGEGGENLMATADDKGLGVVARPQIDMSLREPEREFFPRRVPGRVQH